MKNEYESKALKMAENQTQEWLSQEIVGQSRISYNSVENRPYGFLFVLGAALGLGGMIHRRIAKKNLDIAFRAEQILYQEYVPQ